MTPFEETEQSKALWSEMQRILRELIDRAYRYGMEDGKAVARREAAAEMRVRLEEAFASLGDTRATAAQAKVAVPVGPSPSPTNEIKAQRVEKGTVEPALRAVLLGATHGLTTEKVHQLVNIGREVEIKRNSVRGTLNRMRLEGHVVKDGNFWFLSPGGKVVTT